MIALRLLGRSERGWLFQPRLGRETNQPQQAGKMI
jgi:hypothetical protein